MTIRCEDAEMGSFCVDIVCKYVKTYTLAFTCDRAGIVMLVCSFATYFHEVFEVCILPTYLIRNHVHFICDRTIWSGTDETFRIRRRVFLPKYEPSSPQTIPADFVGGRVEITLPFRPSLHRLLERAICNYGRWKSPSERRAH